MSGESTFRREAFMAFTNLLLHSPDRVLSRISFSEKSFPRTQVHNSSSAFLLVGAAVSSCRVIGDWQVSLE